MLGLLTVYTLLLSIITRWIGPHQIELSSDALTIPTGMLQQRKTPIALTRIERLRLVGRGRGSKTREALYVVFRRDKKRDNYCVVMSDMFIGFDIYEQFRDRLIELLRAKRPTIPIDRDGCDVQSLPVEADSELEISKGVDTTRSDASA